MYLSVVIPFKDEKKRLPKSLGKILEYFDKQIYKYEIILVDDGSRDETVVELQNYLDRENVLLFTHKENKGKGAAIQTGVLNAEGDLILFSDADMSTPIHEIEKLIPYIQNGYDITFGSRALPSSDLDKKQPILRQCIGKFGNLLIRIILGLKYADTQCGFKLFKADVAKKLFSDLKMPRWSFDYEVLYKAKKQGIKAKELGVRWVDSQPSNFHPLKDSILSFWDLLRIKLIVK